ncbi:hypothetical protein BLSMQ_1482 [Brevibacterium aurantiacum]|uniref:Uncharacterized protein n=1 Tax=Brevibacterium aurantiacum TaxID=273384 RepID=A0A1D7W2K3_BREAU|nr:hypothetical protein BLSMQ_1482 [Brevibacterium aurantiacum]
MTGTRECSPDALPSAESVQAQRRAPIDSSVRLEFYGPIGLGRGFVSHAKAVEECRRRRFVSQA